MPGEMRIHDGNIYSCLQIAIRNKSKARTQCSLKCAGGKLNNIVQSSRKDILLPRNGCVLQGVQIKRSHSSQQIHLVCSYEETPLVPRVDFPEDEKRDDDGPGEILLEERSGIRRTTGRL